MININTFHKLDKMTKVMLMYSVSCKSSFYFFFIFLFLSFSSLLRQFFSEPSENKMHHVNNKNHISLKFLDTRHTCHHFENKNIIIR